MTKHGNKRKESSVEEGNNRQSNTPISHWYPSRTRFTLNLRSLRNSTEYYETSPTKSSRTKTRRNDNEASPTRRRTETRRNDNETSPTRRRTETRRNDNETSPTRNSRTETRGNDNETPTGRRTETRGNDNERSLSPITPIRNHKITFRVGRLRSKRRYRVRRGKSPKKRRKSKGKKPIRPGNRNDEESRSESDEEAVRVRYIHFIATLYFY